MIPLAHGDAEIFFRQGHLCRAHVLAARVAHIVFVRRDIVDDGVDAAVLYLEERLVDGVEDADIGTWDLARRLFARRADRDAERLALQILGRVDRVVVRADDDAEPCDVVRLGEVHGLPAVVGDRDVVDGDVDFPGLQRRDQAIERTVADLDSEAFFRRDGADDIDVESLVVLGLLVLRAERRIARVHAHAQHLRLRRLRIRAVRRAAAARRHRQRAEQACGKAQ